MFILFCLTVQQISFLQIIIFENVLIYTALSYTHQSFSRNSTYYRSPRMCKYCTGRTDVYHRMVESTIIMDCALFGKRVIAIAELLPECAVMEQNSYLFVDCVRVTGKFKIYMRKGKKASILRLPIAFTHPNGILKMFVFYQLKAL